MPPRNRIGGGETSMEVYWGGEGNSEMVIGQKGEFSSDATFGLSLDTGRIQDAALQDCETRKKINGGTMVPLSLAVVKSRFERVGQRSAALRNLSKGTVVWNAHGVVVLLAFCHSLLFLMLCWSLAVLMRVGR